MHYRYRKSMFATPSSVVIGVWK